MSSELSQWLQDNKLTEYSDKFTTLQSDGGFVLSDLCGFDDDDEIRDFIQNDLGEIKKFKAKRLLKAIKKLRENAKEHQQRALVIKKFGFDMNKLVAIKQESEMEKILADDQYCSAIKEKEVIFNDINVHDAMKSLCSCGKLIQLAYLSSDGFQIHSEIALLLSKYHELVADSFSATNNFVRTSFIALDYHKFALKIVYDHPKKAGMCISKCSDLAEKMQVLALGLVSKVGNLQHTAEKVMKNATDMKQIKKEKKQELVDRMREAKSRNDQLVAEKEALAENVKLVRQEEARLLDQLEVAMQRQFKLDAAKCILQPITDLTSSIKAIATGVKNLLSGNNANNENQDEHKGHEEALLRLERRLDELKQRKNNIFELERDAAKAVLQNIQDMKHADSEKTLQERAITSLVLTTNTLFKIKATFTDVALYWKQVKGHCDVLKALHDKVLDDKIMVPEEVPEQVADSAFSWFVLGKINYCAKKKIKQVYQGMNSILNTLPTNEVEAKALQAKLTHELDLEFYQQTNQQTNHNSN